MSPRAVRIGGRVLIASGAVLAVLGLAMPAIATGLIHDSARQAQTEVDRAKLNLIVATINLGTKVSVYGTVEGLANATDLDFIPDNFPLRISAMRLTGLDGLVIFDNKLSFANGDLAVVEGYYVSFSFNNTTYAAITGTSLPLAGLALAAGLESGAIGMAKVFRPWWDSTGLTLVVIGASTAGAGAVAELGWRRLPTPPAPAAAPTTQPPGPPPGAPPP